MPSYPVVRLHVPHIFSGGNQTIAAFIFHGFTVQIDFHTNLQFLGNAF